MRAAFIVVELLVSVHSFCFSAPCPSLFTSMSTNSASKGISKGSYSLLLCGTSTDYNASRQTLKTAIYIQFTVGEELAVT